MLCANTDLLTGWKVHAFRLDATLLDVLKGLKRQLFSLSDETCTKGNTETKLAELTIEDGRLGRP